MPPSMAAHVSRVTTETVPAVLRVLLVFLRLEWPCAVSKSGQPRKHSPSTDTYQIAKPSWPLPGADAVPVARLVADDVLWALGVEPC